MTPRTPVDLSKVSDLDCLRVMANESPQVVDILSEQIDKGRTDEQIIALVCKAGGSPQAMRWTRKGLNALRGLQAANPEPASP